MDNSLISEITEEISETTIETYNLYNYLHFNTIFRNFSNIIFKTNSEFVLSSVVNNISEIKLVSINIKKPYLISNSKSNNKFRIKVYKNNNSFNEHIINISNGYYEDISEIEDYLNNNYFYRSSNNINSVQSVYFTNSAISILSSNKSTDNNNNFLKSLHFKIDPNTYQSIFELDQNYIDNSNNNNYKYFELDFNSDYVRYYSLAEILGFNFDPLNPTNIKKPSNIYSIISDYPINNKGNNDLFFCFDENQGNIIETHKLFLNNNLSTFKVLAKINASTGNKGNNFIINQTFSLNDRTDNIRKYSGLINLQKFTIKIIDYYGNIINQDINANFTFSLEAKIKLSRLIN